jgi:23S rRNA (uracil1939-C5)-methyltransferase
MRLVIEKLGQRGDGLAQVDGRQVVVPGALPGEVVEQNDKGFRIVETSADRIDPFCPVFETCGGCKFQHLAEVPYAVWKRDQLVQALVGQNVKAEVGALIDAHGQGRRRASFHVRRVNEVWQAGFMAEKTHDLVAIQHCPILVPRLAKAPELAASFGPLLGNCDVVLTAMDNGIDVYVKADKQAVDQHFAQFRRMMETYGVIRVSVNAEVVSQSQSPVLKVGTATVSPPPGSFLQATSLGEETLARLVLSHLGKSRNVLDLFCGVGPFALRIAEKAKVYAIDSDKKTVAALAETLRNSTGLKPVKTETRDLFKMPLTFIELADYDCVVFDPPRAGAEAQARQLAKSKVRNVIAVACDAQSFARDARILIEGGYRLTTVTPVDQFKYSTHVEIVAHFTRAPKNSG